MALKKNFLGKEPYKEEEKKSQATDPAKNPVTPIIPRKEPATTPPKEDIVYRRNESGKVTGLEFSDGRSFTGLDPRDAVRLAAGYKRSLTKTEPPKDEPTLLSASTSLTPPASPQSILPVGQINPLLNNETTGEIQQNLEASQRNSFVGQMTGEANVPGIIPLNKITGMATGALNSIIKGSGTALINEVSINRDVRAYLSDYSNQDNFKKIEQDIQIADEHIRIALSSAKSGENPTDAVTLYNAALSRKALALRQLKLIASKDQKAYIKDVKLKMIELEAYFQDAKRFDDEAMNRAIYGGVPNG